MDKENRKLGIVSAAGAIVALIVFVTGKQSFYDLIRPASPPVQTTVAPQVQPPVVPPPIVVQVASPPSEPTSEKAGNSPSVTTNASPPPPNEPTSNGTSEIVYITTSGSKYHKKYCEWLSHSSQPVTLAEAEMKHLTPCHVCFGSGSLSHSTSPPSSEQYAYIGNRYSRIYHRSDCDNLPSLKYRVYFRSRYDAESQGYTYAKDEKL